jgi:hypothetical protein
MDSANLYKKILVLCKCVRTVHLDQEKAGNILISQKNGDIFKSLYSGYQKLECTCSFIEKNYCSISVSSMPIHCATQLLSSSFILLYRKYAT